MKVDKTEDLEPIPRRFDAIARVINGGEICSAVCFDGKEFILANNSSEKYRLASECFQYFREVVECAKNAPCNGVSDDELQSFVRSEMSGKRERLMDQVSCELNTFREDSMQKLKALGEVLNSRDSLRIEEMKKMLQDDGDANTTLEQKFRDFVARNISAIGDSINKYDRIKVDLAKVEESIIWGCSIRESEEKRGRGFTKETIEALQQEKYYCVQQQPNMHAEMQVLGELIRRSVLGEQETGELKEFSDKSMKDLAESWKKKNFYIGITKLCCRECICVINAVNELIQGKKISVIEARGTHLNSYDSWWMKPFFVTGELEKLYIKEKANITRRQLVNEEHDRSKSNAGEIVDISVINRNFREDIIRKLSDCVRACVLRVSSYEVTDTLDSRMQTVDLTTTKDVLDNLQRLLSQIKVLVNNIEKNALILYADDPVKCNEFKTKFASFVKNLDVASSLSIKFADEKKGEKAYSNAAQNITRAETELRNLQRDLLGLKDKEEIEEKGRKIILKEEEIAVRKQRHQDAQIQLQDLRNKNVDLVVQFSIKMKNISGEIQRSFSDCEALVVPAGLGGHDISVGSAVSRVAGVMDRSNDELRRIGMGEPEPSAVECVDEGDMNVSGEVVVGKQYSSPPKQQLFTSQRTPPTEKSKVYKASSSSTATDPHPALSAASHEMSGGSAVKRLVYKHKNAASADGVAKSARTPKFHGVLKLSPATFVKKIKEGTKDDKKPWR